MKGALALMALLFAVSQPRAAGWKGLEAAPGKHWKTYASKAAGVSFQLPPGVKVKEERKNGIVTLRLSSGASPASDIVLKAIPYGREKIVLPDRSRGLPEYSAARNRWLGADPRRKGRHSRPLCLKPVVLSPSMWAYEHTDAQHGWSSVVYLGDRGKGYVLQGPADSDGAGLRLMKQISRTFRFLGGAKPVLAKCTK